MSRLEELIQKLCPDGVEYKNLGDVCTLTRGRVMSKDYLREFEGEYPVYSSQTANNGIFGYINTYDYDFESITWTTDGANAGSVFYHDDEKFSITNVCGLIRVNNQDTLSVKFVYHFLHFVAKTYVSSGMGNPKLMSNTMARVVIPLPPLQVQEEIVRILDNFTQLTAELTAELTARKKQYEYYKKNLLENIEGKSLQWMKLKDCVLPTSNIKWSMSEEKGYQYIDLSSVDRDLNKITEAKEINWDNAPSRAQQMVKTGDVLFGTTRPMLKRYCIVDSEFDEQICSTGFCVLRADPRIVLQKWILFHVSSSEFYNYVEKYQQGASYPAITDSNVKNYEIPVPPIEEQARIVSLLDRFDTLCNDLSSGLPAEIEARQKQYEYYRDKLLTFKEVES